MGRRGHGVTLQASVPGLPSTPRKEPACPRQVLTVRPAIFLPQVGEKPFNKRNLIPERGRTRATEEPNRKWSRASESGSPEAVPGQGGSAGVLAERGRAPCRRGAPKPVLAPKGASVRPALGRGGSGLTWARISASKLGWK